MLLQTQPVGQLPQTAYQTLLTPYAYFGLGRTNNYIENLFAGSTKHEPTHYINMEMVIPNSKLVINPAPKGDEGLWRKELYLRPGEWIPWVGVTVLVTMVLLAGVVFVLHLNEKVRRLVLSTVHAFANHYLSQREDELERRRASHHINFDAL